MLVKSRLIPHRSISIALRLKLIFVLPLAKAQLLYLSVLVSAPQVVANLEEVYTQKPKSHGENAIMTRFEDSP
jgi:hypothetical protein